MNLIRYLIIFFTFLLTVVIELNGQVFSNEEDTIKLDYIPFSNIEINNINKSFYTKIENEAFLFNLIHTSSNDKWFFIGQNYFSCNLYSHLRVIDNKVIVYSAPRLLFDENRKMTTEFDGFLKTHILNNNLKVLYSIYYLNKKFLFLHQYYYNQDQLLDIVIKVNQKPENRDLTSIPDYDWLENNRLYPISIYVPHYAFEYVPFIWLECIDTPNVLMYNYLHRGEEKYRRLSDAIGEEGNK